MSQKKTSIETNYSNFTFYIDDVQVAQYQPSNSGQSPWVNVSYPVLEGNHTFKWTYSKDGGGGSTDCSNTGCDDAGFVDDFSLYAYHVTSTAMSPISKLNLS